MADENDHAYVESFVKKMEKRLKERLRSLREDLSHLEEEAFDSNKEASGDLSSMPIHSADQGTDTYERNRNLGEIKREQKELDQIQNALDKIESGEGYGYCEECEEGVGRERLKAIPYTPYCIDCATEAENKRSG